MYFSPFAKKNKLKFDQDSKAKDQRFQKRGRQIWKFQYMFKEWERQGMVEEIWPNVAHSLRFCKVSVGNSCIFGKVGGSFLEKRKYCHEKAHEMNPKKVREIVVIHSREHWESCSFSAEDHLWSEEDWNKHLCLHRLQGDREKASEDSDDGADAFDSESDDADGDKYESDDFSDSDDDVE